jgi:hypothetical protein
LAHLWIVTIHPFDEGEGGIARAIANMARDREKAPIASTACPHKSGEWCLYFLLVVIPAIDQSLFQPHFNKPGESQAPVFSHAAWFRPRCQRRNGRPNVKTVMTVSDSEWCTHRGKPKGGVGMKEIDTIKKFVADMFAAGDSEGLDRVYAVLNKMVGELAAMRTLLNPPAQREPLELKLEPSQPPQDEIDESLEIDKGRRVG